MSIMFVKYARGIICSAILAALILNIGVEAKDSITATTISNVELEVASRKLSHGTKEYGIYIFKLYCGLGECTLQQLTLNECENSLSDGLSFIPRIQIWSTWAGNLEVQAIGSETLELKVFQGTHRNIPAQLKFTYSSELPISKRVTNFEAKGFINPSSNKDTSSIDEYIEFTPLIGAALPVHLDCPVLLRGIER